MNYFDYAATCPIREEALEAFVKASREYFGNSSSLHDVGGKASSLLEACRNELALLASVKKDEVYFTSGGSESNHLGILSLLSATLPDKKHIITTIAEHSSIHQVLGKMEKEGYPITYLSFQQDGVVDLNDVRNAIRDDTALMVIQHVNGEIGTIQPLKEIGRLCREYGILLHSDCIQSFGKIDIKPIVSEVDSFSIASHKVYGPKGVGALVVKQTVNWKSSYPSISHEKGMRPGTVNVPGILGFVTAAQLSVREISEEQEQMWGLRKAFIERLKPIKKRIHVYESSPISQLPSTIGFSIDGVEGQWLMLECNRLGFAISTGSACQSGNKELPKTMVALGVPDRAGAEFARVSFGKDTTTEDVHALADCIMDIARGF
ncbi:IscS subfamily cysteine desulfurase [Terrihalobacillus insolitus]|uniref:IscS subfamily cysteine desulfurase n=1 Tax=Terrihalobacillus insolitus TaxID=2950438 RepID=UPI002341F32A|nr:IscS subfamily cysteine desulfurase [Terrihalobacillus insolitus]MDC3411890.1 IscS subfamily cysteine desulfurase [Terrihalobacillus insolitus]